MSAENASNQPTTEVFEIDGIKPDFTFSVGTVPKKVTFVGHRTVLAMVSRVFSQMFKGSRDDGDQVRKKPTLWIGVVHTKL